MTISDGQRVRAQESNAAWVSKTAVTNNTVTGIVEMANVSDPQSGVSIPNVQEKINDTRDIADANTLDIADLRTLTGTVDGDTALPSFTTPGEITNPATVFSGMEELNISLYANNLETTSLRTLSGTTAGDDDLGTFTGTTITDANTIKGALQELETEVELKEDAANKGVANGYCPLNGSTLIDAIYLPSYVDDVLEYANLAAFPVTGETGKIYVALDTNKTYRWSGTIYVEISPNDVNSVNGQTGIVVLELDDIDDVNAPTPNDGDCLVYDTGTSTWVPEARSSAFDLDDLGDVNAPTPADGDVLTYDTGTSTWINQAPAAGVGELADLTDVDDALAPNTNDVLTYDGTEWTALPSSGSGLRNFISTGDSDFEAGIGTWITFDDGSSYVDGTGGSPTAITIAQTVSSGEVLEKLGSLKISKSAASGQGEGTSVSTNTIDRAARGEINYITFQYDATSTNYVADDLLVKIYDVTNAAEISALTTSVGLLKAKSSMNVPFLVPTTCTQVRVSIYCNTTNASAYDVIIDKVSVSNQTLTANISPIHYLGQETWSNTSGSTCTVTLQQEGEWLLGEGYIDMTGAFADTELNVVIPAKYTADSTWYQNIGTTRPNIGIASLSDAGAPTYGTCLLTSTTVIRIQANNASGTYEVGANLTSTVPFTWNGSDYITFNFKYKVANFSGLTSTSSMSNSVLGYARGYLAANQSIPNTTQTKVQLTGQTLVGTFATFDSGTYRYTFTKSCRVTLVMSMSWATSSSTALRRLFILKNGATGILIDDFSSNSGSATVLSNTDTFNFVSGDYIELYVQQVTGGSLDAEGSINTSFLSLQEVPFSTTAILQQNKVATVKDVQTSGTNGGGFTSGAWQVRTLNTLQDQYGLVTSLSSNTITLLKGVYLIEAQAPALQVDAHKVRIQSTSGTSITLLGSSEYSGSTTAYAQTVSKAVGVITLTQTTALQLQHYAQTTKATNGFGTASGFGVSEVYGQVTITKIAE